MEADKTSVTSRSEILFVYDVIDANPNGDPNDENRPRMDEESGRARVSDVRLKRTIRDYLHDAMDEEIFCRQIEKDDGSVQTGKDRADNFFDTVATGLKEKAKKVTEKRDLIEKAVLESCIDVRLFGATIPVAGAKANSSITLTGPVQFAMGSSLHRVEPEFIKGTGAFASGEGAQQQTFREEYILPYALIAFYGIVNQQAAKSTHLTPGDVEKLYRAIWSGTRNLITRSKIGHRPLLLLAVEYKPEHSDSYIGRLDRFLSLATPAEVRGEALRDPSGFKLDLGDLGYVLSVKRDRIERVRFAHDARLLLTNGFTEKAGSYSFHGIPAEQFPNLDAVQATERPAEAATTG